MVYLMNKTICYSDVMLNISIILMPIVGNNPFLFADTKIKNPCLSRVSWFWATNRQQECRKQVQSVRKHEQNLITKAHTIISPLFSLGEYSQLLVIG